MSEYIYREIKWRLQDVHEYGGEGEYAGSFDKPVFVCIQRAIEHDCAVAKHRKTELWYWFRQDDTLLPWADLRNDGACEIEGRFLESEYEGPFATEKAAKRFGQNYVRQQIFNAQQKEKIAARFEKASKALKDLLEGVK